VLHTRCQPDRLLFFGAASSVYCEGFDDRWPLAERLLSLTFAQGEALAVSQVRHFIRCCR